MIGTGRVEGDHGGPSREILRAGAGHVIDVKGMGNGGAGSEGPSDGGTSGNGHAVGGEGQSISHTDHDGSGLGPKMASAQSKNDD